MSIKERPILFSGPMVRAILDGRKTQTRRVVKPQDSVHGPCEDGRLYWIPPGMQGDPDPNCMAVYAENRCPYGKPEDRLWVRETFVELRSGHEHNITQTHRRGLLTWCGLPKVNCIEYRADATGSDDSERCRKELGYKWKPSIFMPRWASRITLEITSVRVERLNEISEEDAIAEGCPECPECVNECGQWGRGAIRLAFIAGVWRTAVQRL